MGKHTWKRIDNNGSSPQRIVLVNENNHQRIIETNKGRFLRMKEEVKSGKGVRGKKGNLVDLTPEQIAYNKGFLRAYRDNAKMYSTRRKRSKSK